MPTLTWALITGEYPPQPGGVSDYTRLLARALAELGDEVHVWAPACPGPQPRDRGVEIHRLPGHFGPRALRILGQALDRLPRSCRILVQYVPHSFGFKAMNLFFCWWLSRRHRDDVGVMFHEVFFPLVWRQPLSHKVLGVVTRLMAALMIRAGKRLFVSIPAWEPFLRQLGASSRPITYLPIPSNLPAVVPDEQAKEVRERIAPCSDALILGHFSTFGSQISEMLAAIVPPLLAADARRVGLLLGRGSKAFGRALADKHPYLKERIQVSGELSASALAAHLAACDLLLQPYPDGISSRRTSAMSGLALGRPMVTTQGDLTEIIWQETAAVALAPANSPELIMAEAEALLADAGRRIELGHRAAALYEQRFSWSRTVRTLRDQ